MKSYDVIIIGAGSVGVPLAWKLAEEKVKVLVLEAHGTHGQGQNKAAIGGVRATHSDPAKIQICQKSLEIVSTWKERYGDDIEWLKGGYAFPAYTEKIEETLKTLLKVQKDYHLNIDWIGADAMREIIPGLSAEGLRGGTFSPDDGQLSPLKLNAAFYRRALHDGAEFHFNEKVTAISLNGKKEVKTSKGEAYSCDKLVLAAGAEAREVGALAGFDLPVAPDSHEAGITEPVKNYFAAMVVDIRERPMSKNFYFYQNDLGQIIFCVTPSPLFVGTDRDSTSSFLPLVAKRLIEVMPRLRNIKVRRTWRGLYPMTPDGVPIVDEVKEHRGLYLAVGMCGQGLMLGPGLAVNLASLILRGKPEVSPEVFSLFSLCREFSCVEMLK
jgi:sarcosine oxidase subunit beta